MTITFLTGDCRDVLPTLADASVQCVVCSPPYYGLRDYGTAQWEGGDAACDHVFVPDAGATTQRAGRSYQQGHVHRDCRCGARRIDRQIGLEKSPEEFIATLVEVFRQIKRVMRDDATCWVNLGDSFHEKQLLMMPARVALALQADGWWLRSDIIWAKPNPMPESCRDRPTSAHEHVFLLTKRARYYYDADAVREDAEYGRREWTNGRTTWDTLGQEHTAITGTSKGADQSAGRNCRNVWSIPTHAYSAAHFATYPPELVERCIRAGTSERGCCAACGAPWVRQTSVSYTDAGNGNNNMKRKGGDYVAAMSARPYDVRKLKDVETLGWSPSCTCGADVAPCTILDPFSGAGTTALVADRLQRNAIAIDLSHEYRDLAAARIAEDAGLFADIGTATLDDAYDQPMRDLFANAAD